MINHRKVLFLGSKKIGYECLRTLIQLQKKNEVNICGIVTNPERENPKYSFSDIASASNIKIYKNIDESLARHEIDFIVSVQYHKILSTHQIQCAKSMAINLHMAPLPEYRGCNQFSFAIYNKTRIFGATLHIINEEVDGGDILAEERFEINEGIDVVELYNKTYTTSLKLFNDKILAIMNGECNRIPQNKLIRDRGSKLYYRKDIIALKQLNLEQGIKDIVQRVKATSMTGFEPPYFEYNSQKYFVIPQKLYEQR